MSTDEDPVAGLRSAILERKALAVAACGDPGHPVAWVLEGHGGSSALIRDEYGSVVVYDEGSPADEEAVLIAANDPQDTIARCEAELAILDEHARVADYPPEAIAEHRARGWPEEQLTAMAAMVYCDRCHTPVDDAREDDESQCLGVIYPCRTVRLLASGYRHWPGFPAAFAA